MRKFIVYMHINKINNKKYVGITCQTITKRWGAGEHYQGSPYFYRAIKKYGWDKFDHEIIATDLNEDEAKQLEIRLIKELNLTNSNFGYNLTAGGQGRLKYTTEEEIVTRDIYWLEWQQEYNKVHKEYFKKKNREYYEADPEKFKNRAKKYYQDNKESMKEYSRNYKKEHSAHIRAQNKQYDDIRKKLRAQLLAIANEHPEYFTKEELCKLSKRDTCRNTKFLTELLNRIEKC